MKYLLITILFLFGCPTKQYAPHSLLNIEKGHYIVHNQPQFPENYHQIEYIGNWTHMPTKPGSWAETQSDTARYRFWGYGIQIMTELWDNHKSYQVLIDGNLIETINVQDSINTSKNLTYSNMGLKTGNHILEIVPNGKMVLNQLGVFYYADPTPEEIRYDTIYVDRIVYEDSLIYVDRIVYVDSIVYKDRFIDKYHLIRPKITYDTILIN